MRSRAVAGVDPAGRRGTSWVRVREVLASHPGAGIAAILTGHAVMVAAMVTTPLQMHHGGAELG